MAIAKIVVGGTGCAPRGSVFDTLFDTMRRKYLILHDFRSPTKGPRGFP